MVPLKLPVAWAKAAGAKSTLKSNAKNTAVDLDLIRISSIRLLSNNVRAARNPCGQEFTAGVDL
jgi:hypothetical protein